MLCVAAGWVDSPKVCRVLELACRSLAIEAGVCVKSMHLIEPFNV